MKYYILVILLLIIIASISPAGCRTTEFVEELATDTITEGSEEKAGEGETAEKETPDKDTENKKEDNKETDKEDSHQGEYFTAAILKSIDIENNIIMVEQLINDPDEKIIGPEITLSADYKVVKSILDIEAGEEKYIDMTLNDIPAGSEIGILFNESDTAELIIYQITEESYEKERLENVFFSFFDSVKEQEEYKYFSSTLKSMVGSEEEYKNGDKTDIYFIIQESHSSWENIKILDINIDESTATVTFTGDRIVEGIKSEGEKISFNFIKEEDEWKIDFPVKYN
jgi:hypothetical protein